MPSDTIPFPKDNKPVTRDIGLSDAQIAEKIHLAVGLMQETMAAARMAGGMVEPNVNLIEKRQTPWPPCCQVKISVKHSLRSALSN